MKKYWAYILIGAFIFTACDNGKESDYSDPETDDMYILDEIRFFLQENDGIVDTLECTLDTIVYYNNTTIPQPDTVFYPYSATVDSIIIQFDNYMEIPVIQFSDSVEFPSLIMDETIYFSADYPVRVNKIPDSNVIKNICAGTSVELSPTPQSRYNITGKYFRIRARASFEVSYVGKSTGQYYSVTGKWYSSKATLESFDGSECMQVITEDVKN